VEAHPYYANCPKYGVLINDGTGRIPHWEREALSANENGAEPKLRALQSSDRRSYLVAAGVAAGVVVSSALLQPARKAPRTVTTITRAKIFFIL
jgi:hypothetical protein